VDEKEFWRVIALLDWDEAGDDDAVLKPARKALAKKSLEEIAAFENILCHKLHALDTMAHARHMGEGAYEDEDSDFSADVFLYARCCVVANGREYFEAVLADPAAFPEDLEFEALLELAASAHELKTGEEVGYFETDVSYETFSNAAGWAKA
jgi:hypothetical protein